LTDYFLHLTRGFGDAVEIVQFKARISGHMLAKNKQGCAKGCIIG
jgi:hypothetical protein